MVARSFRKVTNTTVNTEQLAEDIRKGHKQSLAKAITLIESQRVSDRQLASKLLESILPYTGKSVRIGISGVPGAGKSTFIEAFGMMLCELGYKVAVLAIDPSSARTGGSILGDKTRMEQLSRNPRAFIRPSPTAGTLGGVNKKTRETLMLCEAANYNVILIETVGVGQSETIVREMVDFFLLLVLTGAGDELQGMKKGIMEIADLLVVNKADGDNEKKAKKAVLEFNQLLHFLHPATEGWTTSALAVSSLNNTGLSKVWETIEQFVDFTKHNESFNNRRLHQAKDWFRSMIEDELTTRFFGSNDRNLQVKHFEKLIEEGKITPSRAVEEMFLKNNQKEMF